MNGPPGLRLGAQVNIYGLVRSGGLAAEFYSNMSINMRQQGQGAIEVGSLIRTGLIRAAALNRATELMRVLELGVIWELRQQFPDEWILLDGPIAPLTEYARLAAPELQGLQSIAAPVLAFDFLRRLVGAVKEVTIVLDVGLEQALQNMPNLTVPVYRFGEVLEQEEERAREVLSAYVWLRRELSAELSPIWSAVSGLARFDVSLPAVLPNDPQMRNTWNIIEDDQVVSMLQLDQPGGERLREVLECTVLERWPVPPSSPTRVFVELYPVTETELWLTASLYDNQEIQARGTS